MIFPNLHAIRCFGKPGCSPSRSAWGDRSGDMGRDTREVMGGWCEWRRRAGEARLRGAPAGL